MLSKNDNVYTQIAMPGSFDNLVDELLYKYDKPIPGSDLFITNSYHELMDGVLDIRDLGSGVIGGTKCDHLALRKKDVDFEIWIAQGEHPYPCRYDITTKVVTGEPEYSIQISNWKTGQNVAAEDFSFTAPAGTTRVDFAQYKKLRNTDELPSNFVEATK